MTIEKMRKAREAKSFYRNSFRRIVWLLIGSLAINGALVYGIYIKTITKIEPNYYATSGIKAPIRLTARLTPNYSSEALLPPDPTPSNDEMMLTK